jgi:hypothetical protein
VCQRLKGRTKRVCVVVEVGEGRGCGRTLGLQWKLARWPLPDMAPEIERQYLIAELPNHENVGRLMVLAHRQVALHVPKDDYQDLHGESITLTMYFLMPRLRLMEPWSALMKMLIHSSKV